MNIRRSHSVSGDSRCIFPRAPNTVNMLRSQSVRARAQEHYLQYIRTLRSHKTLAKHDEYSSFSKRDKGIALYIYSAFRSPIIQSAIGKYSSFSKHENPAALYIRPQSTEHSEQLRSQSVRARAQEHYIEYIQYVLY